jgi:glycerol-3-phosphate cytidylyltransferase-like family protein
MKKSQHTLGIFQAHIKCHIKYFYNVKSLGYYLLVIGNKDKQSALKGSKKLQLERDRVFIVTNIKSID